MVNLGPQAQINSLDSTVAESSDVQLNSWLDRFKHSINLITWQLRAWINEHSRLDEPLFLNDPHPQYWHKVQDSAWAHMYFQDFVTPKIVAPGGIVTGWTGKIIDDWQLVSDPVAGTVIIGDDPDFPKTGTYFMSLSGFIEGTQNTNYIVSMYADGVVSVGRAPVVLKGNATNVPVAWAGLIHANNPATLDLRLESSSTGANIEFYTLNWCLHRINPVAGTVGMAIDINDMPAAPPSAGWDPG